MTLEQVKLGIGIVVSGVALAVAATTGYHFGAAGVQADWTVDKLSRATAEKNAVLAAVQKNEADRKNDLRATKATLANVERKLNEANDRITAERAAADRERLRITIPQRDCPTAAGETAGAGRADAAGAVETVDLPAATERRLRDVAEGADREVERLRVKLDGLQDWVASHGFYEVGR